MVKCAVEWCTVDEGLMEVPAAVEMWEGGSFDARVLKVLLCPAHLKALREPDHVHLRNRT